MVPSESANPQPQRQLRRATRRVWFHNLLGHERFRRGGSRHESGQSGLDSGEHQHPDRRHELFQRSAVDELLSPLLPPPNAMTTPAIRTNAAFGFTNGVFGFNVTGPSGSNVVIQASTDLKTWIPLQTNLLGSGLLYFSDSQSPANVRRFYRAQLSP